MTLSSTDLLLYAGALAILFITPGPVWVGIIARALSGGFQSAWPLAFGVVIGDIIWPLFAIIGLSWITDVYAGFMDAMRWVALVMFVVMGINLIRKAGRSITGNSRLTRPGMWAGFLAGIAIIISNPKAVLFYMGLLPGFFDLGALTWTDIGVICLLSLIVPLIGNLGLALFVDRARRLVGSPSALKRINIVSGVMLILVGVMIGVL